jgi:tetratricopeptide (TPR) repeat protein
LTSAAIRFNPELLMRKKPNLVLALALCCLLSFGVRPSASAEPPDYQRAIGEAVAHFEARRYPEARERFAEAHALSPSARTLRALGLVEFELGNYVESVTYLEQALGATSKPLDAVLRREAMDVLARAKQRVSLLRIAVTPADATLLVDGAPAIARSERGLTLLPGEHRIEASAAGRKGESTLVRLAPGEERSLSFALARAPEPEQIGRAAQGPDDLESSRALLRNPWLWSGVGIAVVALVTGLAVGLGGRDSVREAPLYGGDTGAILSAP